MRDRINQQIKEAKKALETIQKITRVKTKTKWTPVAGAVAVGGRSGSDLLFLLLLCGRPPASPPLPPTRPPASVQCKAWTCTRFSTRLTTNQWCRFLDRPIQFPLFLFLLFLLTHSAPLPSLMLLLHHLDTVHSVLLWSTQIVLCSDCGSEYFFLNFFFSGKPEFLRQNREAKQAVYCCVFHHDTSCLFWLSNLHRQAERHTGRQTSSWVNPTEGKLDMFNCIV